MAASHRRLLYLSLAISASAEEKNQDQKRAAVHSVQNSAAASVVAAVVSAGETAAAVTAQAGKNQNPDNPVTAVAGAGTSSAFTSTSTVGCC
jgi:hypothetical protein